MPTLINQNTKKNINFISEERLILEYEIPLSEMIYDFYNKGTLRFDGSNDYVFLSNSQLNIYSTITVEAWVKYNAQGGYNARAYSVITCKGYPWTWLLEDQSGQFNFRISTSVNSDSNVNSSYSHGLNTWNHVVGTYDGTSQKIYVDGVLRNTVSLTGAINTSSNPCCKHR